jgi:hypothetical protein
MSVKVALKDKALFFSNLFSIVKLASFKLIAFIFFLLAIVFNLVLSLEALVFLGF